jgi:hypothetical protein
MGLKGDVEEVVLKWREAPWWLRVWLGLSGFLAVSSIASMAESVAKWKGFFKDALEFYRATITVPLRSLLQSLGIDIVPIRADLAVIGIVAAASLIRHAMLVTDWKNKKDRNKGITAIVGVVLGIGVGIYRSLNNISPLNWYLVAVGLVSVLLFPIAYGLKKAWIYYVQLGGVIAIVCTLAAINAGLSR